MVFPTLFTMYICLPQCNQTSACLNATKHLLGSTQPKQCPGIEFHVLYLDKFRLGISDLRISSLKSQDPRFQKTLVQKSCMDPRSKISENYSPEILDPWIQDPRFQKTLVQKSWIHGSYTQDPWIQVGSLDPRFLDKSFQKSWILDPWMSCSDLRISSLKSQV